MKFEKWQGLGNDFILVDQEVSVAQARALCDRRRGVGGDGVLLIDPAEPRMVVLNADGSRPEMCGNGLRCVAGWLVERGHAEARVALHTDAGVRTCEMQRFCPGRYEVRAFMGHARTTGELVHAGRRFARVDVGNPHAVCFDALAEGEAASLGPAVEAAVEGGVNVELVQVRPDGGFDIRVFERGVGWTDACGTGACAVAHAAVEAGLAKRDMVIGTHLPGGRLDIEIAAEGVYMRGPAERVFVGEVTLVDA